jgi:hypothetical protein
MTAAKERSERDEEKVKRKTGKGESRRRRTESHASHDDDGIAPSHILRLLAARRDPGVAGGQRCVASVLKRESVSTSSSCVCSGLFVVGSDEG